ncbi:MAG: hypothetical protein KDN18_06500 [Verrucomicrobiae bacterium]|nr:hypothetical protein [Verrucomicrobiae bacterium]
MTSEPTPTETPARPENLIPIGVPVDAATPPPPSPEEIAAQFEEARQAFEHNAREAIPFNRLAIHTGFQQAIQAQVASAKPEKVGMLCTAFRNWAEAESLLRG